MKAEVLIMTMLLGGSCAPPEDDPPAAPDPIGSELLSFNTLLGIPGCGEAHLYRARRSLQFQCFALDGTFSWENHGLVSPEGEASLDAELAAADLHNTTPGDYMGLCHGSESGAATMTLWVGDQSISYPPVCPIEGIEALNVVIMTLLRDISDCEALDLLESVEPGCRAY